MKLPFFGRPKPPEAAYESDAEDLAHNLRRCREGVRWLCDAKAECALRFTEAKTSERGPMAVALLKKARAMSQQGTYWGEVFVREELIQLAGRLAGTKGAVALEYFPQFVDAWLNTGSYWLSYTRVAGVAEYLVTEHGLQPEIEQPIRALMAKAKPYFDGHPTAEDRRQLLRLNAILDPATAKAQALPEVWQAPFVGEEWEAIVAHAASAKSNAMSEKWAKGAVLLLEKVGKDRFLEAFGETVDRVGKMPVLVDALHSDMLRGLAWLAGLVGTSRAATLLGRLVVVSAHKIVGTGARSQKGFSGAVGALERMGTFEALSGLSNARNRVKAVSLSESLRTALVRSAERQRLPLEDLEELVVPTYGLEVPVFSRSETLGSVEARLEVSSGSEAELRWFRDGRELKAPPAELKEQFGEDLKDLKAAAKELDVTLASQRARIEGLMLSGRTLSYPLWRERYLEHPVQGRTSRRLIWQFGGPEGFRLGMAPDGELVNAEGKPLENLGDETLVRLWHPIHAGAGAIEAWRDFILAREIRQPFKQAFREIYLLTEAEERTGLYSNRFAAHVLKQHQLNALARARGWRYALQGNFDNGWQHPSLSLPGWGLRVEYFVSIATMTGLPDSEVVSGTGIAFYMVTDQVRFRDFESGEVRPLNEIPPIVFSEVMRDVDLFVGVASVGNDPGWQDQGAQTGYGDYWREVSFGDLSATAETRKQVLERLLPRLALGKVSRIDGKFLVVQGNLRTYKIHLGSGNILRSPNDQYLCIVPGAVKPEVRGKVYLPFEGDGVLAIILSKALMLMNDDKIMDRTITRQL